MFSHIFSVTDHTENIQFYNQIEDVVSFTVSGADNGISESSSKSDSLGSLHCNIFREGIEIFF